MTLSSKAVVLRLGLLLCCYLEELTLMAAVSDTRCFHRICQPTPVETEVLPNTPSALGTIISSQPIHSIPLPKSFAQ